MAAPLPLFTAHQYSLRYGTSHIYICPVTIKTERRSYSKRSSAVYVRACAAPPCKVSKKDAREMQEKPETRPTAAKQEKVLLEILRPCQGEAETPSLPTCFIMGRR
jgi:hypothetical protein